MTKASDLSLLLLAPATVIMKHINSTSGSAHPASAHAEAQREAQPLELSASSDAVQKISTVCVPFLAFNKLLM